MTRLSGWQRIGVVLSVLWGVFAVAIGSNDYINYFRWIERNSSMEVRINDCRKNAKKESDPAKRRVLESECGFSDAEVGLSVTRPEILPILAFIFLPIVGGWFASNALVWMTKWVIAGFK